MTCRDCIHENVCGYYAEFKDNADECKHFKNKADFVEVTRCKDCPNSDLIDGFRGEVRYCHYYNHNVYDDDFCSQGG